MCGSRVLLFPHQRPDLLECQWMAYSEVAMVDVFRKKQRHKHANRKKDQVEDGG